ncbi:MAG: ABC transporter permease [Solirubrobacteraceae bacterium]
MENASSSTSTPPPTEVTAGSRLHEAYASDEPFRFRTALGALWAHRDLVMAFTRRVLLSRHRQTALGAVWALVQATSVGVLAALVLRNLVVVPGSGAGSYVLLVLGGAVAWSFFARTTAMASASLLEDGVFLDRVWFPREILPLSRLLAGLTDLALGVAAFAVAAVASGHRPTLAWLALPLPCALLALAVLAASLGPAALVVVWRDLTFGIPLALQLGFFASPVLYPLASMPGGFATAWGIVNPVAGAIDALREIVIDGRLPDLSRIAMAFAAAAVTTALSYALLKWLEPTLSDRL